MTAFSPITPDQSAAFADLALPPIAQTASGRRWRLREADGREALAMSQQAEIEPLLARVLAARGVTCQNVQIYLNPTLRGSLPDPYCLKDMETAALRIASALLNGERVGVFGDYDVDGTSAAAILKQYFNAIGAPLEIYLPDRMSEGYGPSIDAFLSLKQQGVKVIITVDCGAAAHEPIKQAAAQDLDIVILDHHMMNGPPPLGAVATVNPNRPDDISGLENLSAAGVAFMTVIAVNRALREAGYFKDRAEPNVLQLLDLTALGLVCDVMQITGLTRVLVAQGLKVLGQDGNPGLAALGARAGMKGPPSTYHLGFLLGPRINAAGRIGHARLAFELLTTTDDARRQYLAEKLHVMNAERQAIEGAVQEEALRAVEKDQLYEDAAIIVAGEGWHPGVVGIVAGRLKEKFDRPVVIIGVNDGVGKGSGRSISGVDLGGAISAAKNDGLLIAGGGHAMAAGLTIAPDKIAVLRQRLNATLAADIARARENRTLEIDAVIAPGAVTKTFAEMMAEAGPYGPGNPEPVFALTDMRADYVKTVGQNHISLVLKSDANQSVRAIAFRAEGEPLGEVLRAGGRLHIAGRVKADDWRGGDAAQLQISDAAPAS